MSGGGDVRAALTSNLKALHLPTMRHCYEEAARRAEKETLSYETVPAGTDRAGVRRAAAKPDSKAAERIGFAAGRSRWRTST